MNPKLCGVALAGAFLALGAVSCAKLSDPQATSDPQAAGTTATKAERIESPVTGATNSSTGVGGSSSGTIGAGGLGGTAGGSAAGASTDRPPRAAGSTLR